MKKIWNFYNLTDITRWISRKFVFFRADSGLSSTRKKRISEKMKQKSKKQETFKDVITHPQRFLDPIKINNCYKFMRCCESEPWFLSGYSGNGKNSWLWARGYRSILKLSSLMSSMPSSSNGSSSWFWILYNEIRMNWLTRTIKYVIQLPLSGPTLWMMVGA